MDKVLEIPFVLNGKKGTIEVKYEVNNSIHRSGFDLIKNLGFKEDMCIGYPTMNAYVKDFDGTGYYTASAWIQIVTDKFYSLLQSDIPTEVITEVDANSNFLELGVPFFAFGSPAEIYDAPCNNLGNYERLEWIADTFLVTQPSRINNDTIMYLLGFRWGYEESEIAGKRYVKVIPIEAVDISIWNKHLPLLKRTFSYWRYE